MLLLQRKGKPIDDRAKDLQKLSDAIESFRFVSELEKDIVNRAPDI